MSYSSSCHPTSIFLRSNKFQNGDIPVLANPGPAGKCPLKRRKRKTFMCLMSLITGRICRLWRDANVADSFVLHAVFPQSLQLSSSGGVYKEKVYRFVEAQFISCRFLYTLWCSDVSLQYLTCSNISGRCQLCVTPAVSYYHTVR